VPRTWPLFAVLAILSAGWFVAALLSPQHFQRTAAEYAVVGMLIGTLFGHAVLMAAWSALGPFRPRWRLPLSLAWLTALALALAFNIEVFGGPGDVVAAMTTCLFGMWLLILATLGGLAWWYRLTIRDAAVVRGATHSHPSDCHASMAADGSPAPVQFGIGQLMKLTAAVAVVLGVGRLVVPLLADTFSDMGSEAPIFIFLAVAGIVMTLPLALAVLLPRQALLATLAAVALIMAATWWELPLLDAVVSRGGPKFEHIVWINLTQALWVLAVTGILRAGGYRLVPK